MKLGITENKNSLSSKLSTAKAKLLHQKTKVSGDIVGNIAILKFDRQVRLAQKKKRALKFLKEHKQVSTVLQEGKFTGRLRTKKTKWIAGENTKEALYKENSCIFRFNVESCYFSPRLSSERKEIAGKVKKKENVLVMFGGVGPFAIVIGKLAKPAKIVSVELGRECSKYAKINVKRNKLEGVVEVVQGDVRKLQLLKKVLGVKKGSTINKITYVGSGFDRIVMARPNLKDDFLEVAFPLVKKGGVIHYYGFSENRKFSDLQTLNKETRIRSYEEKDISDLKKLVVEKAKKAGRKIKILKIKKAGDIGPYRFRYRADVKVL